MPRDVTGSASLASTPKVSTSGVREVTGKTNVTISLPRLIFALQERRRNHSTVLSYNLCVAVLGGVYEASRYRADDSLVFCHPALGTPLDPSKLARAYMRPALARAKITKPFRPWHDLRHTSLTHEAAAGNPQSYVQLKAGHSQGTITERYIHAAQVLFPGAASRGGAHVRRGR